MKNIFEQFEIYLEGTYSPFKSKPSKGRVPLSWQLDSLKGTTAEKFIKSIDSEINRLLNRLAQDLITARPTFTQSVGNWWKGIKDFFGSLWRGDWRYYHPKEAPRQQQQQQQQRQKGPKNPPDWLTKDPRQLELPLKADEVYNAKLYNLTNKYVSQLNEATMPHDINMILKNFKKDLIELLYWGIRNHLDKVIYAAKQSAKEELVMKYLRKGSGEGLDPDDWRRKPKTTEPEAVAVPEAPSSAPPAPAPESPPAKPETLDDIAGSV